MRRTTAILLAAGLVLGVAQQAASAGTRTFPTQSSSYSANGAQTILGAISCPNGEVSGTPQVGLSVNAPTVFFHVPSRAGAVSFAIADQSGTPVMAYVWHGGRPVGGFCGTTTHPFKLSGSGRLWVTMFDVVTTNDGPSIVTTGTVTATFSG